ncbi:hypothetical protein Cantr_09384 [Candida viswanathii]|uniref:Uncharacterized protein n=1 Tax=Candida viswanathii TaxID=5486 RepID=A0A367YAK0_9ASCO|nr:hypothetical protein Cantr_09384 [Candida viswanathii]
MSSTDLKIKRILNHEKTSTGVFLEVLFVEGQKAWLSLHIVSEMCPGKTDDYLDEHPELLRHHRLYFG